MEENFSENVSILGAGLVGSLLAIFLKKKGFEVTVFEKRQDPRTMNSQTEGKSINLALSHRGIHSLKLAGLKEAALEKALPMKGRMIHALNGHLSFHPYDSEGKVIYSISRAALNQLLAEEAISAGVPIYYENRCSGVDFQNKEIYITSNQHNSRVKFNYLFGTDGAFSSMRKEMQTRDRFDFSQKYLDYGYKEFTIPSMNGKHQLDPGALHIWPREEFMLIALPNLDGSFTCTLFLPFVGKISFASLENATMFSLFFKENFQDVWALMPDWENEYLMKPPASMVMIHCSPWAIGEDALLLGDAAHAIVPFYGQGMNAGFEDVRLLVEYVGTGKNLSKAIKFINDTRKKDTDAIGELALQNFIEMRDLVADPLFILRKKIEGKIIQKIPAYQSLYALVTFSDTPYHAALENSKIQNTIFQEILNFKGISESWDSEETWIKIEALIKKYYN